MSTTALRQRLKELDPISFQDLCYHLVKDRYSGLNIRQMAGASGDEGIDLFAGEVEGNPWVWQCKFFPNDVKESQKQQIRDSLKTVLRTVSPRVWILCLPVDLNPKAARWFERLKAGYKSKVKIGQFFASEILHELIYRRNIRDQFFPGASLDAAQIKALLRKSDELSLEELSTVTAENVEQYVRRLQDKDPRFAFRITFHDGITPDFPARPSSPSADGRVLFSMSDGNKQIDALARDVSALTLDPPAIRMRLTQSGGEKLQRNIETGAPQEIAGSEILSIESTFDFLMPKNWTTSTLRVGPSPVTKKERFHFRVSFIREDESIIYQFLEFGIVRRGTQEMEFASTDEALPFKMSLVLRTGNTGTLNLKQQWTGKDIHDTQKYLRAIRLLSRGGTVELFDLKREQKVGRLSNISATTPLHLSELHQFIDDLVEIADVLDIPIQLPEAVSQDDSRSFALLQETIHKGEIVHPAGQTASIVVTREREQAVANEEHLRKETAIRLELPQYSPPLTLFGEEVNTGPCLYECGHIEIADFEATKKAYLTAPDSAGVKFTFRLVEPLRVTFHRFRRGTAGKTEVAASEGKP